MASDCTVMHLLAMSENLQLWLGMRLRRLRLAANQSQEDFAAAANIDRATFGKLERGRINPSLLTLARVAVALNISLSELLDGVELNADEIREIPRSARGPKPMGGRQDFRFG